jgi:hypothetical protein
METNAPSRSKRKFASPGQSNVNKALGCLCARRAGSYSVNGEARSQANEDPFRFVQQTDQREDIQQFGDRGYLKISDAIFASCQQKTKLPLAPRDHLQQGLAQKSTDC